MVVLEVERKDRWKLVILLFLNFVVGYLYCLVIVSYVMFVLIFCYRWLYIFDIGFMI